MKTKLRLFVVLAGLTAVVSVVAGVSTSGAGTTRSSADEIVIGATIPLTGDLAAFGAQEKIADNMLVNEVNAKGGILVDGVKKKLKLVILDNKTDPNLTSTQTRTLILQNKAVGLFGNIAPPLVIPESIIADQLQVPMTHHTPIQAWLSGRPSGYKYSWDVFFNEPQMTTTQFRAANLIKTNKRVVLFTDTEPDGIVMGGLWSKTAPKFGYKIAYHAKFPVGTTDFSTYIKAAQKAKAEVLIAQMVPPDAIALWKQMKAAGYQPKMAVCEKCSYNGGWAQALGSLAEGTMVADVWAPEFRYPYWAKLLATKSQTGGKRSPATSGIGISYTVGKVLLDAIARAHSSDPKKINAAMKLTRGVYPTGPIKFNAKNYSAVPAVQTQWRNGGTVLVWPAKHAKKLEAPVKGLG